jgi:hypothetical protein
MPGNPDAARSKDEAPGFLPNVLILGAAKCGTTSLHHYLDIHPEISMSNLKELDFFVTDLNWDKGMDWYRSHFPEDTPLRGESSTSYTRDRKADTTARLIEETLGRPKLIYLVRDPIDRIRSDYHQHRAVEVELRGFEEALSEPDNRYVEASRYGSRIAPYVERFGAERILVESQERLLADRAGSLARIFRFLEVDPDVTSPEFEHLWEQSAGKGWAYNLGWKLRQRGVRLPASLRWPAQRLQRSRVLGGAASSARPPEISDATSGELARSLRSEVELLRRLTGAEFDEWTL